ncbi:MAG: IS1634 family transposase [Candidatus Aureabacteria bacterium]|nr:IS1634 family transposase [Candidatus Auribacterota bacterium]
MICKLLEAYRNAEGRPRQRVVVSLGNADIPKKDHSLIAEMVERRLYGYRDLFEHRLSRRVQQWVDSIVKRIDLGGRWRSLRQRGKTSNPSETLREDDVVDGVCINHVDHTDTSSLGPSVLGLHVWKQLGMPELLQHMGFNPAQHDAAAASVINRLVEAEHALMEWIPTSALPELLGARLATSGRDRFYRVSDTLLEHQERIERHLRTLQKRLLNLDRIILIYDLTNFYFEGTARANPKARPGRSREKRDDCPQVVVGMVFDREGFELAHRIFEGNRNGSKTLVEMVEVLQAVVQEEGELQLSATPLVIVDAGVATKKNLKELRECHFDYLVNDTRRSRSNYQAEFSKGEGFETISCKDKKTHVEAKRIQDPQSTFVEGEKEVSDWLILCTSEARREKGTTILSKAEERLRVDLGKLG